MVETIVVKVTSHTLEKAKKVARLRYIQGRNGVKSDDVSLYLLSLLVTDLRAADEEIKARRNV